MNIILCVCWFVCIEDITVHMLTLGNQYLLLLHLKSLIGVLLSVDWVINHGCWYTPTERDVVHHMNVCAYIHWVLDNARASFRYKFIADLPQSWCFG